MSTQTLAVNLRSDSLYVSGTVNDVAVVWTNTGGNTWEAVADRADDDVYRIVLTIITSSGSSRTTALTLYYGLHLVTDRTESDVFRVQQLQQKGWSGMSEEEKAEWRSGMKGAYNASDLNRVNAAILYVWNRLAEVGFDTLELHPKTDWLMEDIPTVSQLNQYLSDVRTLREANAVYVSTPECPESMDRLTYQKANDIEKILEDVDRLLTKMIAAYYYCGELESGEVVS